jgi:hypothetical protein
VVTAFMVMPSAVVRALQTVSYAVDVKSGLTSRLGSSVICGICRAESRRDCGCEW